MVTLSDLSRLATHILKDGSGPSEVTDEDLIVFRQMRDAAWKDQAAAAADAERAHKLTEEAHNNAETISGLFSFRWRSRR